MNESYITLQGWVGNDCDEREVGETTCVSFRVGCTPRFMKNGSWVDGETSWYTVNCWRALGGNVKESVRRGDAVVVHGRVRIDVWNREGQPPSVRWVVDASWVGHDLSRGTSTFLKTVRSTPADPQQSEAVKEMLHAYDETGPRLSSAGEPVEPAA